MRAEAPIADLVARGLRAPICLTWEVTFACNLACVHCLSASGRRDPRELTTAEARRLIDQIGDLGVFYVNVGGGEPTLRHDFFDLVDAAVSRGIGIRFSTNGWGITPAVARRLAHWPGVDVQVSLDGADAATNDRIRGPGSYALARRALDALAAAGVQTASVSTVVTRASASQLDALAALAHDRGAHLRLTRLRPAGRGTATWEQLRVSAADQRLVHAWLVAHPEVATGDSFFHLSALGPALAGLNTCGAGRVVALIDPVGDLYACPFAIHERFRAGSLREQGLGDLWRTSPVLRALRTAEAAGACATCGAYDACHGGCRAAKFFTGLDEAGPDPECALGAAPPGAPARPRPGADHSRPLVVRSVR